MVVVDNSDIHHGDFERIACIVFFCITPLFLLARFWSRIISKQLGNDDWAAFGAFIFAMSCNVMTMVELHHGWGRHKVNLSAKDLKLDLILHFSFQLAYKAAVGLNKASILFLYLRIMPQRLYRIAIYSLLTLVGLFAFATIIAGVFQCVPVEKAWIKNKPGHCYNLVDAWYSNAVFSIITDIFILMLPMHMVYKLQRDQREKLLLYGVFGLGFFVTFTSIMRFFALKSAKNPDTTYEITSGFWSIIEINVGVICICLPPLRSLLSRHFNFFNRMRGRTAASNSNGPYHAHSGGNSELKTIGGTGGTGNRNYVQKRTTADESEEELVHHTGEHSVPLASPGGIMKKVELKVEERALGKGDERNSYIEMSPWLKHGLAK